MENRGQSFNNNSEHQKAENKTPYSPWGKEIKLTVATKLTLVRMALTPFICISIFYEYTLLALILFVIAAISDSLDGFIARLFKQETLLGRLMDPLADKVLLNTVNIILSFGQVFTLITIPVWLTLVILCRDLLIIASVSLIIIVANYKDIYPSWGGKLATIFQFISITVVLLANLYHLNPDYIQLLFYVTLFFTVYSGILYLILIARLVNKLYS
ncbi:MAG: hypothetical protein A2Y62_17540 [Candidatus Fischerbacteria bacterium RBG_13_37_8]|uniref:CDP-diacylglycerol--glycerol-3-phosphate 3-phosphatidyltransferase n=1 Tax=Candidatus Fischerbacteria bacterium RBG_13_37_8 TaxID=1817863 RepID=A0A1F5VP76_9BACT|nr:MAG: hypothetical protein A2Y62_17540 [Candidatus Fischerbacteria bacterium RBG_13_37_8]